MSDAQSQFIAVCPQCSTILKVNVNKLGQNVRCSHCHHTFIAGEAIESAAAQSAIQSASTQSAIQSASTQSAQRPALSSSQAGDQVERIEAVCPGCQAVLHVRRAYIGNDVCCKYCDQIFTVRAPAETPAKSDPHQPETAQNSLQAEHEQLYVAHNLLQADHDRLKTEYTGLREHLGRVTTELDAIRASLGTIAPEEVNSLVNERQSLADEVHRLRVELHTVLAAQKDHDELIAERHQWRAELTLAHGERDLLSKQLEDRNDQLEALRAEHDRMRAEQQTALGEVEDLRISLARSDDAAHHERARLQLELDTLRRELESAEERHRVERTRLDDELAAFEAKQRQLQDELDLVQRQQDSAGPLSFVPELSEDERAPRQQPALGVFPGENGVVAESPSADELTPAEGFPATAAEIESLRGQVAELTQRLDDSERLNRDIAEVLGGLGIRLREMRV